MVIRLMFMKNLVVLEDHALYNRGPVATVAEHLECGKTFGNDQFLTGKKILLASRR